MFKAIPRTVLFTIAICVIPKSTASEYREIFAEMQEHKRNVADHLSSETEKQVSGDRLIVRYLDAVLSKCDDDLYLGFTFNPLHGLVVWQWAELSLPGWNAQVDFPIKWHQGVYAILGSELGDMPKRNGVEEIAGFSAVAGRYQRYRFAVMETEGTSKWSPWFRSGERSPKEYPPSFTMRFIKQNGAWRIDPASTFNVDSFVIDGNEYSELRFTSDITKIAPEASTFLNTNACQPATAAIPAKEEPVDTSDWGKTCRENVEILFPELARITKVRNPSPNAMDLRSKQQCSDDVHRSWDEVCEELFYVNQSGFNQALQELVRKSRQGPLSGADIPSTVGARMKEWRDFNILTSYQILGMDCAVDGTSIFE